MKATLNVCSKCGEYYLANKEGINDYCPHCNSNESYFLAYIDTDVLEQDRIFLDHDAGETGSFEEFKERYIRGVRTDRLTHVTFNEWIHSEYYGIYEFSNDELRNEVFPYLSEIVETYCPATDQTYLIGRWITDTWSVANNEKVELINYYYGHPEKEHTELYLGKLKDLALNFIPFIPYN